MAYDDNEENPPVGFERDPESDDIQDGTWIYADGSRKYGSGDPDLAKSLLAKSAGMATGNPAVMDMDALDSRPKTAPLTDEEKAPLQASPDEIQALGGADPEPAPIPAAQTPAMPAAPALAPPPSPGGRLPLKGVKDTTSEHAEQNAQSSQSVSRTGSAQDRGEFEQQQHDIARGYDAQSAAADKSAATKVAALQNHRNLVAQMGADKEVATAAAQASADTRKQQVIKKFQEIDSRKTDINQLWKDKGALGTALGLLGVGLRSLTATKFGGPNTALQAIQEQKRQAIQAQLEDRNSELRGLERELGSIEAAQPVLEARMNDALNKRLDAMTIDEKSADVLANKDQMQAQLQTQKAEKLAEGAKAYHGTLAQQQSMQAGQTQSQGAEQSVDRERPTGAGTKPMTPKELAETDKMWEEQGKTPEERAILWQKNGYAPPTGKTAAELKREGKDGEGDKRSEDQGKIAGVQAASDNYARAMGGVQDKDGRWVKDTTGTVSPKSAAEVKAAKTALRTALRLSGYDEKAAETATPEAGNPALDLVPFGFLFNSDATQEDQFAQLNSANAALNPRLNPADRAASTSTERGAVKGKKVGNMAQAR